VGPQLGRDRIYGMWRTGPTGASRARGSGACHHSLLLQGLRHVVYSKEIFDHVVGLMRERGADVWFELEAKELMPAALPAELQGHNVPQRDEHPGCLVRLGVSHAPSSRREAICARPATCTRGSDQHRGCFTRLSWSRWDPRAGPYTTVLTTASSSTAREEDVQVVGNVIDPQAIIDKFGAEILRLWSPPRTTPSTSGSPTRSWSASSRPTAAFGTQAATSRQPQRLRCEEGPGPYAEMEEIDRWALYRLQALIERTRKAYENFQFHIVYYTLYNFCTVDLSSFISTCSRTDSTRRQDIEEPALRTERHVHHPRCDDANARPILTFTAEEVWQSLPLTRGKRQRAPDAVSRREPGLADEKLGDTWKTLIAVRGEISKAMETAGRTRSSATRWMRRDRVRSEKLTELLARYEEDMRAFCIISGSMCRRAVS